MPGPFTFGGFGCDCCECPQLVCVNVRCKGSHLAIADATVEIREAADPVGSGSVVASGETNATGGFCLTTEVPAAYDIVISKEGYHAVKLGPYEADCDKGLTVAVGMCPEWQYYEYRAIGCGITAAGPFYNCGIPDVVLTSIVDDSTATTDADGRAVLRFPVNPETCLTDPRNMLATPPAGSGYQEREMAGSTFLDCRRAEESVGLPLNVLLHPVESCVCAGVRYPVSKTLSYSDDWGSCECEWIPGQLTWRGWYTYEDPGSLGGLCYSPYGPLLEFFNSPTPAAVTVQVDIGFANPVAPKTCETTRIGIERSFMVDLARRNCLADGNCFGLWAVPAPDNPPVPPWPNPISHRSRLYSRGAVDVTIAGTSVDAAVPYIYNRGGPTCNITLHPAWGRANGTATITGTCDGDGGPPPAPPITVTVLSSQGGPIPGAVVRATLNDPAPALMMLAFSVAAEKIADGAGQVVFSEDDGLDPETLYTLEITAPGCTQPTPAATFQLGDDDLVVVMDCPIEPGSGTICVEVVTCGDAPTDYPEP
jgi:hypothetical protein